jgi:integrase
MNDSKLEQWFNLFELSDRTREIYTKYMQEFSECIGLTPTQMIEEAIVEIKAGKLPSERNILGYVAKFKKCMKDKDRAEKSQAVAIACIKSFFKAFDIQLPSAVRTPKKPHTIKENDNFLSREDVTKLIANAKSLRDKCLLLVMATSGLGRKEIRNLRIKDVQIDDEKIGTISIRRQKSKVDFTTFCSPEATAALQLYFAERKRSPTTSIKGERDFVFVTYDNGSQILENTFTKIFEQLARELGYVNGSNFIICRPHAFRKFFASTLENSGLPKNKIEYMLGHTPAGSDLSYYKTDTEALKQLYIKFLPFLTFERNIEIRSLNTEDARRLEELEKENELLKTGLRKKDGETSELRARLDQKDGETQGLKKRLDNLEAALYAVVNPEKKA